MALTPKTFYRGQPTTSVASIYTSPSAVGRYSIVKELVACNTSSIDQTVNVYSVASGGVAAASCALLDTALVEAKTTAIFDLSTVLESGAFISASTSASATITLTISGVESS